jgi:hypothetical protein
MATRFDAFVTLNRSSIPAGNVYLGKTVKSSQKSERNQTSHQKAKFAGDFWNFIGDSLGRFTLIHRAVDRAVKIAVAAMHAQRKHLTSMETALEAAR